MADTTLMAYVAKKAGEPLAAIQFPLPTLGENDVRVSVTHCGLCYTDIQGIEDYYGITEYPFSPGHEIVGNVSEISKNSHGLKVGDRVGIGWLGRSCGRCEWCLRGEEQLCIKIVQDASWLPNGGFASSVRVDGRFAYTIPESMPSEDAAVLMCAGITVYSALQPFTAQMPAHIGIVGVGGLGHLAIQFAHAFGFEVTAISSSPAKKEEAAAFGADHFLCLDDRVALAQAEFRFDFLLCTAHGDVGWEPLLDSVKKRGTLLLAGFPNVSFNSTDFVAHELSIKGVFLGNRAAVPEMLRFAQAHAIKPRLELMPMSQINDAIQRVKENKARYRIVLVND